ncbi:hypothetical protein [Stagnihabitans tardus]|uniref:Uncharacterized protein n=1 Tax=Stagnihabitans tardus TaxID=2699202 RepID=A0AAE5BUV8_9RHOB|nr:hypothetical protein [Stagnihabitans tardus]NBZ86538.1 hypothetical protein [Stagnihabitans tardus]
MPHRYRIQPERELATFLFNGKLTVAEGAELFLDYVRAADFNPQHVMLCDARGVTEIEASFLSIFTKVARLAPELSRFRHPVVSVVLVSNQTVFGYVRMLEQILDMTTVIKMRPVWTEEEALALAGRTELSFASLFAT